MFKNAFTFRHLRLAGMGLIAFLLGSLTPALADLPRIEPPSSGGGGGFLINSKAISRMALCCLVW